MHIAGYSSIQERMRLFIRSVTDRDATASFSGTAALSQGEDTVSFSEAARLLAQNRTSKEADSQKETETSEARSRAVSVTTMLDEINAKTLKANDQSVRGESTSTAKQIDGTAQNIEALQRQIEAAQKQLDQANQALQKATTEAKANPDLASEDDSADVKEARTLVTETNNQLVQLQEQLTRAMREAFGIGPGGGGCIVGTRAGTSGFSGVKGHIGQSTDPYAAARAAEQAERGMGESGSSGSGETVHFGV